MEQVEGRRSRIGVEAGMIQEKTEMWLLQQTKSYVTFLCPEASRPDCLLFGGVQISLSLEGSIRSFFSPSLFIFPDTFY